MVSKKSAFQILIQNLIKSFGLKRNIAAMLQTISLFPGLGAFAVAISHVAAWLGVLGLAHSAVAKTAGKSNTLATIAAILLGVAEAAAHISVLAPYASLLRSIADIFSPLAVGYFFAKADES